MHPVLLALGGVSSRVRAGNAAAEKQVIIAAMLVQEGGLDAVIQAGVVGDLVRRVGADLQRAFERDLVEILPVGAELKVLLTADGNPVGINTVVGAVGGDTDDAVVSPGARFHSLGGCYADFRGLGAKLGEHVVHVVCSILVVNIRGLDMGLAFVD